MIAGSFARIRALAWNGMRQAVRDKVLYVLGGFCAVLIAGSVVVSTLTIGERARIVMDLGLSATAILSTLTTVFVTINQVAREIDRRTIASILSKPVARWELVAGRFCGMAVTLLVLVGTMGLLHAAVLRLVDGYSGAMWTALYLEYAETLVVVAIALCLSSFITTLPAIFLSLAFVVIGHTSQGLAMLADRLAAPLAIWILHLLYLVLPNLELLNVRDQVVWGVAIPPAMIAWGTTYALGYSALLLAIASFMLSRRDLT